MHQNILVFYKGNPKDIKANFPKIDYTPEDEQQFEKEAAAIDPSEVEIVDA
jgi:hypothetical protein